MNRWSRWGVALFLVAFVAVSSRAQDAAKKDEPKKDAAKKDEPKKDEPKKEEPKKPVAPVPPPKTITLPLGTITSVDPGKQRFVLRIKEAYIEGRQVRQRDKDLTLDISDKVLVRLPEPKESFDEMGNVKKYTPAQKNALRGKDKLFDGEFSDLTNGQIAQVTILAPKVPTKPVPRDNIALDDNKLYATRIAILQQPPPK